MSGTRIWIASLVALALAGVAYQGVLEARRMQPVTPGNPAADFHLKRFDGKGEIALAELRGKVVMLDFWATWCRPCIREMPLLTQLAKEYASRGLVFVAANRDEPDTAPFDVKLFIDRVVPALAEHAVYADDAVGERYRLRVLPTLYFIGREGQILQSHLGQAAEADLRRWIERALAEPAAAPFGPAR